MDKSKLKKFATSIRIELMQLVSAKLEFLLNLDIDNLPIQYKSSQSHIKTIINRTQTQDQKEDFIEEVSYTWFNRLVALRFMDANNITDTLVVTPLQEGANPAIFADAKEGTISDDLNIDRQKFFDLIDGKINSSNPENEAYSMLFISVCNYYSSIMPFMFESIADYTELLLPEDLLSSNSVRAKVVGGMSEEDCSNIEVIGWLYQFYINEKKDEVIQAKKKYKTSEIPFASQLFTPDWLVQYMTDNTLGQLWLENNPNSSLKDEMKYYVKRDTVSNNNIKIEDIKIFDPCCGSAHILVYAFDLLVKIYEEEGYSKSQIPKLILEKNLFGCDIDKRAATLANFALTMKATLYHKRFLKNPVKPNVIILEEFGDERFKGIKNFGSLIRIENDDNNFDDGIFSQTSDEYNLQIKLLTDKFDCIITNPPYINSSYMNDDLKNFVSKKYPNTKSDLFAAFIERVPELTKDNGYMGFVVPYVWMFNKSYEWLRRYVLNNTTITNLVQLEYNAFGPAVIPVCSFTLKNKFLEKEVGNYIRLSNFKGVESQPLKTLEAINNKVNYFYSKNQSDLEKIPGKYISYWLSEKTIELFSEKGCIGDKVISREGMATADNDRFLKYWFEISLKNIGFNIKNNIESIASQLKWFPYNKGGKFRKWYGNNEYVVDWENDGFEIRNNKDENTGRIRSHNYNGEYGFKEGMTWAALSSSNISVRYSPIGFLFDSKGAMGFSENNIKYYIALINSCIGMKFLEALAPTMDFKVGDIIKIPLMESNISEITNLVNLNINISKEEWDSREISWNFPKNELLKHKSDSKIKTAYNNYCRYWNEKFDTLHKNEEELNRLFIDIYELQDELTPEVELKDITILKQESKINDNNELEFNPQEIIKQFISYSVGVMFGRYSLDQDGLVVSNLNQDYPKDTTFEIDDDNIIPVLEDDYFTDDIASRFTNFVKVVFGEESLAENIDFIEKALGTTIRKYFVKGFYEDHIKRYKKRPIYWMVSSPKKGFNTLIYMHRYRSDIFATIQNDYLREYITKLESNIENLQRIADDESNSNAERNKASKEITKSNKVLDEIIQFDRTALTRFAQERIDIDLDDGVKVNYCKFKDVLYPITGLCKK